MKKIFMVAIALIACLGSNAQLQVLESAKKEEIGKIKMGMYTIATLTREVEETDTLYTLRYRNQKYTHIDDYQTLTFNSSNGEFDQLYSLLKHVFTVEDIKDYFVDVQLGKDFVRIRGYKQAGVKGVYIFTARGHCLFTQGQVDKLFGK